MQFFFQIVKYELKVFLALENESNILHVLVVLS